MKLSIGIVGLPNVGKSTLFKLLTKNEVLIANYPFATIDPNVGIVPVPDERLGKLTEISKSAKTIPTVVQFYDIAGLVKNAHKGEGLGNQFLSHIKETNAIVILLRCFTDADIIHVEGSVNPLRDLEIIESELVLKDLETVERNKEKAARDARSGDREKAKEKEELETLYGKLNQGKPLFSAEINAEQKKKAKELNLLTAKDQIVLLNGGERDAPPELTAKIKEYGCAHIVANLAVAEDISPLIREAYHTLGLVSFFTTGEKETRAWTIHRGAKAPEAAGTIHTDFQEKFIRMEVVAYNKLVEAGGWNIAKQRGSMRVEGKEYKVQDGDVVIVRHG